jgi:hypothetical protein
VRTILEGSVRRAERAHGGVAGVRGQPLPLCRSTGNIEFRRPSFGPGALQIFGFENYLLAGHLVSIGFDGSAVISRAGQRWFEYPRERYMRDPP